MPISRRSRGYFVRSLLVFFLCCQCIHGVSVWGQEQQPASPAAAEEAPELVPVLIFNIAGTERSLKDLSNMFDVAGRPDMMEVIQGFLGGKAGDLAGLDRNRPLGYMLFLEPSLPPRPRMVFYIPVSNEDELITTLRLGPSPITETGEHTYEIENRGRRGKTPLIIQKNYAFILPTGQGFLKGETFPDPQAICSPMAARYDLSMTVRLRGIPPLIREVFNSMIGQQFAAQLQQRDHERDDAFEFRRAQGMSTMKYLQQLIRDGEEITIGLDSTEDGRRAVLEATTEAKPESEFAKYLTGIAGKQSYFTPLMQDAQPLQVSVSWMMDAREREAAMGHLKALRLALKRDVIPQSDTPSENPTSTNAIDDFVNGLEATVQQSHVDAIIQFSKQPGNELVLIGGAKVVGSEAVGQSLKQMLTLIKSHQPNFAVAFDAHQFQGVTLSKIAGADDNDKTLQQIYGRKPELYLGTGGGVLWFAFGGDETLTVLDHAIELTQNAPARPDVKATAPFQVILHASQWLKYLDEDVQQDPRGALMYEILTPANDSLRFDVVTTESGARAALRFDEGFVHLLGALLAQLYDQSQL